MAHMVEEVSESLVAISSTPRWWDVHSNTLSSWTTMNSWHPPNPNSNSSCDEDMSISTSFTNASNQSGLTVETPQELVESASGRELSGEPTSENHIWSQVLLSVGRHRDLNSSQDDGENFFAPQSSKSLASKMFEPACDYLKKLDNSWEFTSPTPFNSIEKQLHSYDGSLMEHQRLTNLSDLVNNWSIAPPEPQLDRQITPNSCNISLNSSMDRYSETGLSRIKQDPHNSSPYSGNGAVGSANSGYLPCYGHDVKGENLRSFTGNGVGYNMGIGNSVTEENKYCFGMSDVPWSNTRHFSDLVSFSGGLNKPVVDFQGSNKLPLKATNSTDSKKHSRQTPLTRGNGRGTGTANENKKKRSEDNSETNLKKLKHESSTGSSLKIQAPKVKLGDRITALQQIVSPFGKTDTASVLFEAIGYIKFLQEQVQLLSNPYMKSSASKDHLPWGGLERKDKPDMKLDLKSRGLCLVPISCTPQVYPENSGSDYWTPTYRGCLYR